MEVSEVHLERALKEYNTKVNELESLGPSPELVEAYVNRGSVLYMMDYLTSAMEDLDTATEMIGTLEADGVKIDDGTFVKAHATVGSILFDQDFDPIEAYSNALTRLSKIKPSSRHFDTNSIVRLCIEAAENLLDAEYEDEAMRFLEKGLSMTESRGNDWLSNRRVEMFNLLGEAYETTDQKEKAVECYSQAAEFGTELMDAGVLEETDDIVVALISRGECERDLGLDDQYLSDTELAVQLLEEMLKINKLQDSELIVKLHQDLAHFLIEKGKMEEAEKHLMKAMTIGVNGAKDYIRQQTNNPIV